MKFSHGLISIAAAATLLLAPGALAQINTGDTGGTPESAGSAPADSATTETWADNSAPPLPPQDKFNGQSGRGFSELKAHHDKDALGAFNACFGSDYANAGIPYNLLAEAFFGRGVARARLGDAAGGRADIAAAKTLDPTIATRMARLGVTPPAQQR